MSGTREDRSEWWDRLELDSRFIPYLIDRDSGVAIDYGKVKTPIIDQFDGTENVFLSNFYSFAIKYKGLNFATNEHAYQWAKAIEGSVAEDEQLWSEKIRLAPTAGKTKKLGRQCPMRPDWEQIKFQIMREVLAQKFTGTSLWPLLDATGDAYLIEGNTWCDCTYGICIRKGCERCKDKIGHNYLGLFLMELRQIIRKYKEE